MQGIGALLSSRISARRRPDSGGVWLDESFGEGQREHAGLGPALDSGDVLEGGLTNLGVLLEGEESLWVFVMEIDPPRRDYPRAGSALMKSSATYKEVEVTGAREGRMQVVG